MGDFPLRIPLFPTAQSPLPSAMEQLICLPGAEGSVEELVAGLAADSAAEEGGEGGGRVGAKLYATALSGWQRAAPGLSAFAAARASKAATCVGLCPTMSS